MITRAHGRASRRNSRSALRRSRDRPKRRTAPRQIRKGGPVTAGSRIACGNSRSFAKETKQLEGGDVESRSRREARGDGVSRKRRGLGLAFAISDKLPATATSFWRTVPLMATPLEPRILIDNKDKSAIAESDIDKLMRDAKERRSLSRIWSLAKRVNSAG